MKSHLRQKIIEVATTGRGLYLITDVITTDLELPNSGFLHCFIPHTSASLLIQENADPTAKEDLEEFLNRLIPDGEHWYTHTLEGPDDSTSHLKSALTLPFLLIPIISGRLGLGVWQGIYIWEHRVRPHRRKVIVSVLSC